VFVADLAPCQRLLGPRQLRQLAGDLDPLGGLPTGELLMLPHPVHHAERAIGLVGARLLEAPGRLGQHRLGAVDQLTAFDQGRAQLAGGQGDQPGGRLP
jgi:hypothetical protein